MAVAWTAASVVVVMIATGGIALAGGASTGRSIHGCVSTLTRVLRIARNCRADESAISWNQRGPAGPPGSTGAPGFPGPAGRPGGPPHAVTYHDSAQVHLGFAATDVISSPSMLPGDSGGTGYVLSASVDILAPGLDGSQVSVTCELSLGGATVESTVQFPSVGFAGEGPVYLSLEATISAPAVPTLTCSRSSQDPGDADKESASLTAIQITPFPG